MNRRPGEVASEPDFLAAHRLQKGQTIVRGGETSVAVLWPNAPGELLNAPPETFLVELALLAVQRLLIGRRRRPACSPPGSSRDSRPPSSAPAYRSGVDFWPDSGVGGSELIVSFGTTRILVKRAWTIKLMIAGVATNRRYRSWKDRAGSAPMRYGRSEGDSRDERSAASRTRGGGLRRTSRIGLASAPATWVRSSARKRL